jgi:hypothetical protein
MGLDFSFKDIWNIPPSSVEGYEDSNGSKKYVH